MGSMTAPKTPELAAKVPAAHLDTWLQPAELEHLLAALLRRCLNLNLSPKLTQGIPSTH